MLIVLLMVILPLALITAALAREAAQLYQRVRSGDANPVVYLQGMFDALPDSVKMLLDRFGLD
ncbi:AI-2E family transporter, partial [Roseateles sp. GG27B]